MKRILVLLTIVFTSFTVMSQDAYIGEIKLFAGNFPPKGWAFCSGQVLSISQNTALFSILGTTYGGDGRTTFALPDLRGRVPVHPGFNPKVQGDNITLGEEFGSPTSTLLLNNLPIGFAPIGVLRDTTSKRVFINSVVPGPGLPFDKYPPSLGVNYIICMYGIYPPRD